MLLNPTNVTSQRLPTKMNDNSYMIGKRYGKLEVLKEIIVEKNSLTKPKSYFLCKCDCHGEIIVVKSRLEFGITTSCGCTNQEIFKYIDRKEFNNKIKKRYGYKCDLCGEIFDTTNICIHHLKCVEHFPEQKYNLDNLLPLCYNCHEEFHCDWMGSYDVKCSETDYKEYKESLIDKV